MVIEKIAEIIFPVFLMIGMGYGYALIRRSTVQVDMAALNRLIVDVLCPILIFTALTNKEFNLSDNGQLILAGVLISLGSGVLAWPLARILGYDARTFIPPMIFNNCGNMGLPLAAFAFGSAALPSAVALFLAGGLVYFTAGIKIISRGTSSRLSFLHFFANPVMGSMIAGIVFPFSGIEIPIPVFNGLKLLGESCIPLMLFSLGARMMDVSLKCWYIGLTGAVACPVTGMCVAMLLDFVLELTSLQRGQMYLFASLPPAVFCFIVAEQYNQEPEKVAAIVLLGNLMAVVFVPIGLWLGLRM